MQWLKGERGEWYVVVQGILFALIALGPEQTAFFPRWAGLMAQIGLGMGLVLAVLGVALCGAGLLHLGPSLTPYPRPKSDSTFVQSGAYSLVRHPIYSGLILGVLGWAALKGSTLMLIYALLLFIFFDLKTRKEEAWLREKFEQYASYQQKVKKLIPFVY